MLIELLPATRRALWANARTDLLTCLSLAQPRQLRGMLQFAESEIVIPNGPFEGLRFSCERQPYVRPLYETIDSGEYNRVGVTGPTQSGKTLSSFVIPTIYHQFEVRESTIVGVPTLEVANDKWNDDLRPVIEASRFARYLPTRGPGSRTGRINAEDPTVRFGNGTHVKFMTAGGDDKKRSAKTSRVLMVTETDGMDEAGGTSREGSKIEQMEARTNAYDDRSQCYFECTASIKTGFIWRFVTELSTASVLVCPCPHCGVEVAPDREHFVGWREANSIEEAAKLAHFICPACATPLSEDDRLAMNNQLRLVHNNPESRSFGFRYSAFHNLFATPAEIGKREYKASTAEDADEAERAIRQFTWTLPYVPNAEVMVSLTQADIIKRTREPARGVVPHGALLTAFLDLGKYLCHWAVVGWYPGFRGHVIDYDSISVQCDRMPLPVALLVAMRQFREICEAGWPVDGEISELVRPKIVGVDSSYWTDEAYLFVRECGALMEASPFTATKGYGVGRQRDVSYSQPKSTGARVKAIGDHWHTIHLKHAGQVLLEFDSDYWKTRLHQLLAAPVEGEGALTLYDAPQKEHTALARHITAEKAYQEFKADKGVVTLWKKVSKDNHWLDCLANCAMTANLMEIRTVQEQARAPREDETSKPRSALLAPGLRRPDGRPW